MRIALLVVGLVLGGCAHGEIKDDGPMEVTDFYPLAVGHAWTYRVRPSPPGADPRRTIRIVERTPEGLFANDAGSRLSAEDGQIVDGERVLLKGPLEVGTAWIVVPSAQDVEKYRIVSVSAVKQTPAGMFRDCVQVRIEQEVRGPRGERGLLIGVWTYAPSTGPIHFQQSLSIEGQAARPTIEFELERFDEADPP